MAEWREEDHPRDEKGRFTDKDGFYRANTPYEKILNADKRVPLNFFKKSNSGTKKTNSREIPPRPTEAFSFSDKHKLKTHYEKHKSEFKLKNEAQYQKAAIDFWNKAQGTFYYAEMRNKFCKLGVDRLTVCICDVEGTIHSFYIFKNYAEVRFFMQLDGWREINE